MSNLAALKSLMIAQATLMRKIELLLQDEPIQPKLNNIVAQKIVDVVNNEFNVICSVRKKTKRISDARSVAMYLLCKYTKMNLTEIALMLGRSHHTTVIAGKKKVEDFMEIYPDFKDKVLMIEEKIK